MRRYGPDQVVLLLLVALGCVAVLSIAMAPKLATRFAAAAGHDLGWVGLVLAFGLKLAGLVLSFFLFLSGLMGVLIAGEWLVTRLRRRKPPQP